MRAAVFTEYGPLNVSRLKAVATPVPRDKDVLIRVHATPIGFGDTLVRNFKAVTPRKFHMPLFFWLIGRGWSGFRKPRITILGSEFAGEIAAVGKSVRLFKEGDQVFGYCGPRMGACAEYLRMPERGIIAPKPSNMSYAEAAAVPYGSIMAWCLLRKMNPRPGQGILVNGASGGIGPLVLQLAKNQFGAAVTGVCGAARLDYVRALGADRAIDYTKEDFADGGEAYDFIVDILGKCSLGQCRRALKPKGRCVFVSFKMKQIAQMLWTSMVGDKKLSCTLCSERAADLRFVKELIEAGKLKAIVDRCFPLEQAAAAHRYVESGSRSGSVVITVP
jgi:NADPH:quinone reductase-like Zn-dependent oxidoreductase